MFSDATVTIFVFSFSFTLLVMLEVLRIESHILIHENKVYAFLTVPRVIRYMRKISQKFEVRVYGSMVECLLRMCKVLSLMPSTKNTFGDKDSALILS